MLGYNAATGELTLDSQGESGGTIWSYEVSLLDDLFDVDAFRPVGDGSTASIRPRTINEFGVTGIPAGVYSLGSVLPSELTKDELTSSFYDGTHANADLLVS